MGVSAERAREASEDAGAGGFEERGAGARGLFSEGPGQAGHAKASRAPEVDGEGDNSF